MVTAIYCQVPLGVQLKNENKCDEMVDIVESLQEYVPMRKTSKQQQLSTGEISTVIDTYCHRILLGGDQLTVARVRGDSVHV